MNKRPLSSISSPLYWGAFKIAGIYLLIGSLWILFSDRLAERIALNTEILTTLSLYKGWGFVIVTAFLLYWLIQGHTGRLHASEKRLQVVIDALPVLISYIDKNQHYQFANEAYEEWFGEKAEGKHIEEVVGHETYQKVLKHIDKVLSGETAAYETTISDRDGSERFVSATYVPDLDLDGHVRGFFALVQDISEQKEAKEKLRQWADAFEGCAHGIAIGDPDTNRIVVCNPAFANMLKCRVEDIVGSSILSVYAAPDHEHVRSNVERADQIGHARYEARMVRSDHTTFPVQMDLVSVLGDDGELIYRVVTAQDISERKQAEEKIVHQARLLEQVNDAVIASDENFIVTSWNAGAERIFGWKAEEIIGRKAEEILQTGFFNKTRSDVIQEIKTRGEFSAEITQLRKDGSRVSIEARTVALHNESGHVTGYVSINRDITERKRAEEQIERSNQMLNEILASIKDDFYVLNRNWNFVYASRLFTSKIGKEPQDFIGNNIWEMFPKHIGTALEVNFREAMDKREIRRFEMGGKYTTAWYRMTAFPSTEGITVLGTDITEHKRAEEELKKSEERYRYLFQNNPHPMWIYDRKTLAFLDVNEAAIAKYGYSRQEFLSMTIIDIRPPEDVERLMNNLAQPRQPLERSNGWKHRLKDGTMIYVEISSHTIEIDGHESALVVAQDVTERKQAEEALQRSQRLLQDVIDNSSSLIYLLDLEGRFLLINRSLESVLGRPREEVIGKPRDMFLSLENAAKHRANDIKVIETRSPITMEEENDQSDGKYIYLSNKFPLLDPNGNLYGVGGISADITERKQAEEAVRNSQAQMTGIFNSAMDAIISVDAEQRILIFNPAAEMMFRCKQSEAMGQSLDLFIPQRFRTNHRSHVQNFAQTGTTNRVMGHLGTIYGLRKDGEEFPIEASISKINLAGHDLFTVILRDITKRQQTEEALRESEEKFSVIYYKAPFAAALSRLPDGVIVDVNEAFEKVFGYTKQEVLGQTSLELGINPDPEARTRIAAELQARGSVHDLELMLHTKTGHARVFLMNIDLVSISGQKYIFQTAQDITERKQAGEDLQKAHAELEIKVQERTAALSQANSLLQALMDYMPDQIYFKDLQCRFIRNSRSQASLLGLNDPREVIGKTDFDFFPHAAKAFAEEQEVMKSGKSLIDFEEWVVWPDGRESWVSTTKVPLRNSEGETIGIFGISRDITERKHAEQAIRELNSDLENQAAKLQAANKELEAFSYSVSHDLRAPLRAIDGYTRILVEDYEALLDAEGKRVCAVISAEARRMGQLIDDLLAFSRLGRKEMYSSNIDMKTLAVAVLNDLVKEEDRARIDFRIARLPSISADSSLIRQVWVNLLSNALKFTSKKERAVIEVGSKSSKEEVIYFVRDTGAGFDMEYANKLFGVFQRLHSESEFEGTGVGLAIVQRIIRRHNGRAWAEGEIDKGATFYFALPREENHHE